MLALELVSVLLWEVLQELSLHGGGFGGWMIQKFARDLCLKWEKICEYLPAQMKNDVNDSRKLKVTLKLDASPQ